jgi:hypothetical protein
MINILRAGSALEYSTLPLKNVKMYLKRRIDSEFLNWSRDVSGKPLLSTEIN